jgi:predicted dehydrogenase
MDDAAHTQGFRTILATESVHPYVSRWWPPGHNIGYEHEFHHAVADFVTAIDRGESIAPSFYDGLRGLEVLEAGLQAAQTGRKVTLSE